MKYLNKYPKLKFLIRPEEDVLVYFAFEKEAKMFKESFEIIESCFFKKHPKIKVLKQIQDRKKKRIFLEQYVTEYYQTHQNWIIKGVQKAETSWNKIQNKFFSLTDELFKNHPWPKDGYQAFVTIWGIFPRDIKRKTFQFPYRGKYLKGVEGIIAHEMLHFLFYDYLYKHFPQYKNPKLAYSLWILSEAFNEAIMKESKWRKTFPLQGRPYQETVLVRKEIRNLRRKKKSPKEILEQLIPFVVQK